MEILKEILNQVTDPFIILLNLYLTVPQHSEPDLVHTVDPFMILLRSCPTLLYVVGLPVEFDYDFAKFLDPYRTIRFTGSIHSIIVLLFGLQL